MNLIGKIRGNFLNQKNSFNIGFGNRSPFSYASNSLLVLKSPPMHNNPSDLASQAGGKSNLFDSLKRGIQLLYVKFNFSFLIPIVIFPPFSIRKFVGIVLV